MPENRKKAEVIVVSLSRKDRPSKYRKKHRTKTSVKVAPANQDTSSQIDMVNKTTDEKQKLSSDSNSRDIMDISVPFDQYESRTLTSIPIQTSFRQARPSPSVHDTPPVYPRLITPTKDKCHLISTTSSLNRSFSALDQHDTSLNSFRTKSIIQDEEQKKQRYRQICLFCSNYCCLASTIPLLLLLVAIAAILVSVFANKATTTTMTTTTTTTTATTSSTTTTTTTTTTTSTSATTSTSTTTASTTSTTSATSSTSTSSSTSTATSTSSVITTTLTTTIITTVTSSTSTASTTPAPPCAATSVGSAGTLYSTSSSPGTTYTCHAYEWTSPSTGLVTLGFQFRHDPSHWSLDDVSVYNGATQMISNGDFETGSLSPWVRTAPNGACTGTAGFVSNTAPHTGTYGVRDGSVGCADEVSQQFTATAGQIYVISFWLRSSGSGSGVSALVTLS